MYNNVKHVSECPKYIAVLAPEIMYFQTISVNEV